MSTLDLVITPGDPEGIGPEVTAKALKALRQELNSFSVVIVGARSAFPRSFRPDLKHPIEFIEPPRRSSPGYQSGWAVETAVQFVMAAPRSRALITGPISKERLRDAGFPYHGHTDFLADLTRVKRVTMMLANETFRVALVTNHCALKDVPGRVTEESISAAYLDLVRFCRGDLGIKKPKVAILGLNPHCGEHGIMGAEEDLVILPAVKKLNRTHRDSELSGPHPADSFFALEASRKKRDRHDAILALYHDQGLIPLKLSGFSESLNMTLGLPILRTSVDHGTAFDIAGKNKADPGSMIYAIRKSIEYLKHRRKT